MPKPRWTSNASPLNSQNSDLDYENSPYNYRNSPLNYENSRLNPTRATASSIPTAGASATASRRRPE
jgi:hypothetical protein